MAKNVITGYKTTGDPLSWGGFTGVGYLPQIAQQNSGLYDGRARLEEAALQQQLAEQDAEARSRQRLNQLPGAISDANTQGLNSIVSLLDTMQGKTTNLGSLLPQMQDLMKFYNQSSEGTGFNPGSLQSIMDFYTKNADTGGLDVGSMVNQYKDLVGPDTTLSDTQSLLDMYNKNTPTSDSIIGDTSKLMDLYKQKAGGFDPSQVANEVQKWVAANQVNVGDKMRGYFDDYASRLSDWNTKAVDQVTGQINSSMGNLGGDIQDALAFWRAQAPGNDEEKLRSLMGEQEDYRSRLYSTLAQRTAAQRDYAVKQYLAQQSAQGVPVDPSEIEAIKQAYSGQLSQQQGQVESNFADQKNNWLGSIAADYTNRTGAERDLVTQLANIMAQGQNYYRSSLSNALSGLAGIGQQSIGNLAQLGMNFAGNDLTSMNDFTKNLGSWQANSEKSIADQLAAVMGSLATGAQGQIGTQNAMDTSNTAGLLGNAQNSMSNYKNLLASLTGNLTQADATSKINNQNAQNSLANLLAQTGLQQQVNKDSGKSGVAQGLTQAGLQDVLAGRDLSRNLTNLATGAGLNLAGSGYNNLVNALMSKYMTPGQVPNILGMQQVAEGANSEAMNSAMEGSQMLMSQLQNTTDVNKQAKASEALGNRAMGVGSTKKPNAGQQAMIEFNKGKAQRAADLANKLKSKNSNPTSLGQYDRTSDPYDTPASPAPIPMPQVNNNRTSDPYETLWIPSSVATQPSTAYPYSPDVVTNLQNPQLNGVYTDPNSAGNALSQWWNALKWGLGQ